MGWLAKGCLWERDLLEWLQKTQMFAEFTFWYHYDGIIIHNNIHIPLYKEALTQLWFHVQNNPEEPEPVDETMVETLKRCFSFLPPPGSPPNRIQPLNLRGSNSFSCTPPPVRPACCGCSSIQQLWFEISNPYHSIEILPTIPKTAHVAHSSENMWNIVVLGYTYSLNVTKLNHLFYILLAQVGVG